MSSSADMPSRSVPLGNLGIVEQDLLERRRVLHLGQPPNRIDLLTSISGVDFDSAWEQRVQTLMDDQPVALLGWDELIRNKRVAGRQKDVADLEKLLAVAKRNKGAGAG